MAAVTSIHSASSLRNLIPLLRFSKFTDRPFRSPFVHSLACKHSYKSFHSTPPTSSRPLISYRVAVSSTGKGRRFIPDKNIYSFNPGTQDAIGLQQGSNPVERQLSRPDSGEDAFFVSKIDKHPHAVAFGVADGVGGWSQSGVDPAEFSHAFCGYMADSAMNWDASANELRARSLMQMGYERTLMDQSIYAGSSTACIGVACEDGTVQLANLGDSGSVLFRLAAVHHYSTPQTHDFNTPYQLSVMPPLMRMQSSIFGGKHFEDLPQDAHVDTYRLQHGDVLLLATDGVYDNLNNQDILKVVTSRMMNAGAWNGTADMGIGVSDGLDALTQPGGLTSPFLTFKSRHHREASPKPEAVDQTLQALLAVSVAGEAKIASMDFRRDGPFAKESRRHKPWVHWRGGKPDDICVIIVIAVEEGKEL